MLDVDYTLFGNYFVFYNLFRFACTLPRLMDFCLAAGTPASLQGKGWHNEINAKHGKIKCIQEC